MTERDDSDQVFDDRHMVHEAEASPDAWEPDASLWGDEPETPDVQPEPRLVVDEVAAPAAWEPDAAPSADEAEIRPVVEADAAAVRAEQDRLAAERQARRDARLAALTPQPQPVPVAEAVATPAALPDAAPVKPRPAQRTTDKFLASLGLFVLRLVVAAIMGVHGLDKLLNVSRASEVFASTVLPQPQLMTIIVGVAEVAIAIALVFGLLTRLAGLGVALIAGGALAFVQWGPWSPFAQGRAGFAGELELLLAAAGILLLCTGAGGWAIDRGFRARRAADATADA